MAGRVILKGINWIFSGDYFPPLTPIKEKHAYAVLQTKVHERGRNKNFIIFRDVGSCDERFGNSLEPTPHVNDRSIYSIARRLQSGTFSR